MMNVFDEVEHYAAAGGKMRWRAAFEVASLLGIPPIAFTIGKRYGTEEERKRVRRKLASLTIPEAQSHYEEQISERLLNQESRDWATLKAKQEAERLLEEERMLRLTPEQRLQAEQVPQDAVFERQPVAIHYAVRVRTGKNAPLRTLTNYVVRRMLRLAHPKGHASTLLTEAGKLTQAGRQASRGMIREFRPMERLVETAKTMPAGEVKTARLVKNLRKDFTTERQKRIAVEEVNRHLQAGMDKPVKTRWWKAPVATVVGGTAAGGGGYATGIELGRHREREMIRQELDKDDRQKKDKKSLFRSKVRF